MSKKPNRRRPVVSVTLDPRTMKKLEALQSHYGHTYQTQTVEKLIMDEYEKRVGTLAPGTGAASTIPAGTNLTMNEPAHHYTTRRK